MIDSREFGVRLMLALEASGMTQKELAERIGKSSVNTISYFVNGGRKPSIDVLFDICNTLNVSADYLIGRTKIPCPTFSEEDLAYSTILGVCTVIGKLDAGLHEIECAISVAHSFLSEYLDAFAKRGGHSDG